MACACQGSGQFVAAVVARPVICCLLGGNQSANWDFCRDLAVSPFVSVQHVSLIIVR